MPKGISEAGKECRKAKKRLLVINWPEHKDCSVKQTCKYFDNISKRKFYLWKKREKEYNKFLNTFPSPEKVLQFLKNTYWYWLLTPRSRKKTKIVGEIEASTEISNGKRKEVKKFKGLPPWYGQLELSKRPKKWPRK